MSAVLITQCLQNDFVKPLASSEPLPNQLHVGHEESKRLIGEDIETGPIGRFMDWANAQTSSQLKTIHIRDWHDPNCPDQASHLAQFKPHCLQNTLGAEFIFEADTSSSTIIDSTTLNDFEGTQLKTTLDALADTGSETLKIGIIGVWTEAKVLFLAYELATRYPKADIAICSALTASSSRSHHFLALQQLERLVGASVVNSIGEFIQFLGGNETTLSNKSIDSSLAINTTGEMNLDPEYEFLIRYLFRDCQSLSLKILDGGFSGNLVAGANSIDMHGHEQAPHVIKIGPRDLMAKERMAFEQIEQVLGNNAPAIAQYADSENLGAIKYRYASMGSGKTRSLQDCFQEMDVQQRDSTEKLHQYLDDVFQTQLGRFYRAASNDKADLLEYYCFDSYWAGSVKNKIEELIGNCPEEGPITLPGNKQVQNLYQFYKEDLDKLPPMTGDYPFAFVHGDLNGANVIIDERDNVWLIDFFHTHRGHVLKDFAKLENDLLYIYTPIESEDDLLLAYEFSDFLLSFEDPFENLPELPERFMGTKFERTYKSICHIRKLAGQQIEKKDPTRKIQWLIPQLRYAVHTIGFDEPNMLQRTWALMQASVLTERVMK